MPATISLGGQELRWLYGPERQRIRETLTGAAHTLHVAGFAGAYWERRLNVTTNVATVTNYLSFGGETVALVTETSTSPGVITTLWQLKDHLGSTTTLLDASGLISGTRKSYDVWGKRRHVTGEDDTTNSIVSASSRDFTGHEFLEELRLVHMGGRIYDPVVARFLSPDPFVQDPFNLQNLNRYSYVLNNPLAYTDPDGFFFKSISKAFGKLQRFFQRTPIAALAVGLASAWALGPMGLGWIETLSIQSAIVAGSVSGALTDGLRGAIFGAVAGAVTFGIGELGLGFLKEVEFLGKAALHGTAQGALAEARGGKFGPAFLAASFAHAAGSGLERIDVLKGDGFEKVVARTAAASVVGGTASVIGGGKFQNGAATAAFVHLFNNEFSRRRAGFATRQLAESQPPIWGPIEYVYATEGDLQSIVGKHSIFSNRAESDRFNSFFLPEFTSSYEALIEGLLHPALGPGQTSPMITVRRVDLYWERTLPYAVGNVGALDGPSTNRIRLVLEPRPLQSMLRGGRGAYRLMGAYPVPEP